MSRLVSLIKCKIVYFKTIIKIVSVSKSENRQVTGIAILMFPIDCCGIINGETGHLFSGDIQSYIS